MGEHTTKGRRGSWARRTAAAVAVAAVVATAAGPAGAQTSPWTTFPASNKLATGGTPYVLLVGDSLVDWNVGTQSMADQVRDTTGRSTYASAAAGASWVNYVAPGQQNGNALVWDLADFLNARLTIGALASNDARIMTHSAPDYSQQDQYNFMSLGVNATLNHSTCVMLVNVRERTISDFTAANAGKVNDNMTLLAALTPGVYVADWNALATGKASTWFQANSPHLTALGAEKYAKFIKEQAAALIANHSC